MKKYVALLISAIMSLSIVGCSSTTGTDSNKDTGSTASNGYPVTVQTYSIINDGATWESIDATFEAEPERVVCNNQGSAELMIRLGLQDKIVGVAAVFGDPAEDVAEEFNKLEIISPSYASKELVLGANPDCIIGRGDLFIDGDYGVGTVAELNAAGISTYITHVGEDKASYESFLADIENLGKIFNVQDRAAELIKEYEALIDSIKTDSRWAEKELTMAEIAVVEDGIPTLSSPATEYIQNEAFEMIGLNNAFKDYTGSEISVETMIEANPDVLILFDYEGGPDMATMISELYANPSLQEVTAIKNKQVYALDFNEIYGGSGEIYNAMKELAEEIYQ